MQYLPLVLATKMLFTCGQVHECPPCLEPHVVTWTAGCPAGWARSACWCLLQPCRALLLGLGSMRHCAMASAARRRGWEGDQNGHACPLPGCHAPAAAAVRRSPRAPSRRHPVSATLGSGRRRQAPGLASPRPARSSRGPGTEREGGGGTGAGTSGRKPRGRREEGEERGSVGERNRWDG